MKQAQFEQRYRPKWQAFAAELEALEQGKAEAADEFAASYRQLCQLQSLARARHYGQALQAELNQLALRGYHQLYGTPKPFWRQLIIFFVVGFPRRVRQEGGYVVWACLLFYLPALLFGLLVYLSPEWIYSLVDPGQVVQYEEMYRPGQERFGQMREAETDLMMFGFYIKNNISVGFRTFAGGFIWGLGTLFFLIFNGLMIGGIAGYLTQLGSGVPFWSFVSGHSALELTAICFSGAAGLKLGHALLAPGRLPRLEALKCQARGAIELIYGVILMLIGAAFLEAFWSSNGLLAVELKYAVGAGFWLLLITYLCFGGRSYER